MRNWLVAYLNIINTCVSIPCLVKKAFKRQQLFTIVCMTSYQPFTRNDLNYLIDMVACFSFFRATYRRCNKKVKDSEICEIG